ncbi:hypothetical protein D3C86_1210400 [compost metagenome]
MAAGWVFSLARAARRTARRRSTSLGAKAGLRTTSDSRVSEGARLVLTVDRLAVVRSIEEPTVTLAPRRSCASARALESRVVVPSCMTFSIRLSAPRRSARSAATPASNSSATRVTGTVAERA